MADSPASSSRVWFITGTSTGFGRLLAQELLRRGNRVIATAREISKIEDLVHQHPATARAFTLDVTNPAQIESVAQQAIAAFGHVDILVNNAGALFASRQLTVDGIEKTWAVNHLAPFLLTALLSEKLRLSAPARVITTASDAAKNAQIPFDDPDGAGAYSHGVGSGRGFRRYGQTKLANIVFTSELARRLQGSGVTAYSFHPGTVATKFNHNNGALMNLAMMIIKPFSRSPAKGAETLVWLAEAPGAVLESGGFYFDRKKVPVPAGAAVEGVGARLWELSENQVEGTAASRAG